MSECAIPSKAQRVGPHIVDVVGNLTSLHALYLDVSGTSYQVLGVLGPAFLLVARNAAATAVDLDDVTEVLAYSLQDDEEFCVYRIEPAPTSTSELMPLKMRR